MALVIFVARKYVEGQKLLKRYHTHTHTNANIREGKLRFWSFNKHYENFTWQRTKHIINVLLIIISIWLSNWSNLRHEPLLLIIVNNGEFWTIKFIFNTYPTKWAKLYNFPKRGAPIDKYLPWEKFGHSRPTP